MMPEFTVFPEFVPDQVLTSEHLNDLFEYLDEGERMTRASLLGIGIVCGLEVKTEGNKITITKGVGVTSAGYIIRQEEDKQYAAFKPYNALEKEYYEKFVLTELDPKRPKFDLFELKENTTDPESNVLSAIAGGLGQYVVLLFVELLQNQNKNCDPTSCDDKGINVSATIRPLLVLKNLPAPFTDTLKGKTGNPTNFNLTFQLPEVKLPRYNVPATNLVTSENVLSVYSAILSDAFLTLVQATLATAYDNFAPLLAAGSNPFADLKQKFNFLRAITTKNQLLHLQYYYDIISDLLQAYDEFRKLGNDILSLCCPGKDLFPRHLLLGEAIATGTLYSDNRHYFIYSPLFEKKNLVIELRFLMARMEAMKNRLSIPPFVSTPPAPFGIRITPSLLGNAMLSQKAIPYYYNPTALHPLWNFEKTIYGRAKQNLSYHAEGYADAADAFVRTPLAFDLEPHNFLRIEGHVGRRYTDVLSDVNEKKRLNRLPFDVIALRTGAPDLNDLTNSVADCDLRDLQTSYEIVRREWEATVGKMIEYLNENQAPKRRLLNELSVGSDVYGDYLQTLLQGRGFMVESLVTFINQWNAFLPVYEKVESDSKLIRSFLFDRIEAGQIKGDAVTLAEDFIDHCDEVELSCLKGTFRAIHQRYGASVQDNFSQLYFSSFVQKHPGIQHKAGVPLGGTFVLVYHHTPRSGSFNGPFTIGGTANTMAGVIFGQAVAHGANGAIVAASPIDLSTGKFSLQVPAFPVNVQVVVFFGFVGIANFNQTRTGSLLVDSPSQSSLALQVAGGPVFTLAITDSSNNVFSTLKDDEVIADFYLPYLCSSDCRPIQFVIQEPINRSPQARAGEDQRFALPKNNTSLDGSASTDPENKPLSFFWSLVSQQQGVQISDPLQAKIDVLNLVEAGEYVFQLTVSDGVSSSSDQVTVTVDPLPNQAPTATATASRESITVGETVTLLGTGTDPEGQPLTFTWTKVGNSTAVFGNAAAAETIVSNFTQPVPHTFRLTVKDDQGATGTADVTINVNPANQPPVANAGGPYIVTLPNSIIRLDGRASQDPENALRDFLWVPDGASFKIAARTTDRPIAYDFTQAGTCKVTLSVRDDKGQSGTGTATIQVEGKRRNDTCMVLEDIWQSFQPFDKESDPVKKFLDAFPLLQGVQGYFRQLLQRQVPTISEAEQLNFFRSFRFNAETGLPDPTGGGKHTIVQALLIWLEPLMKLIKDAGEEGLRVQALGLLNVLVSLAAYIACIQRDPQGDNRVDVLPVFKLLQEAIDVLKEGVRAFSLPALFQLVRLRALADDEIFVIDTTGQQDAKKEYREFLEKIRSMLDEAMNF